MSSGFFFTMLIAFAGQCLAQLPQSTSSALATQRLRLTTACPIWIEDFSSALIGLMAPAGHTSAHIVHSGRQYPFSYDISGCISVAKDDDGRSTLFGHALTQSWQPVQWSAKCLILSDPAGTILVPLSCFSGTLTIGSILRLFLCALAAAALPVRMAVVMNALRLTSVFFAAGSVVFAVGSAFCADVQL